MITTKLQRIDASLLQEHFHLAATDLCYFIGEYAGGRGYEYSEMNQIINNLKKPIDRKPLHEWHHKEKTISKIASLLTSISQKLWEKLKLYTWVPMPPSKIKSDPTYDVVYYVYCNKLNANST